MKKIILLALLLLFQGSTSIAYGQADPIGDCYDFRSPTYNTEECQQVRNTSSDPEEYPELECQTRKDEGYVWVVFSQSCVNFEEFFPLLVNYVLTFASIIAGAVFIVASYKYMTSRGDPSKTAEAKSMLLSTTVGIIIISLSFVVLNVLNGGIGINSINILPFWE